MSTSTVEARILSSAPAFVTQRRRGGVEFGRDWQEIDLAELGLEATQQILGDRFIETREDRPGAEISKDRNASTSGDENDAPEGATQSPSGDDSPPPKAKPEAKAEPKAKRARGKKK